jgi:hypothetical protein
MVKDQLVTIAEYDNSFDAELAKVVLENEGIRSSIVGDNLGSVMPYSTTPYTVQLQVFEADSQKASEILQQKQPLPEEPEEDEQ